MEGYDDNVVDPPKFITVRNVMNVFDKLGLDPEGGRQIFTALCAVLRKKKSKMAIDGIQEEEDDEEEGEEDTIQGEGEATGSSKQKSVDGDSPKVKGRSPTPPPFEQRRLAVGAPTSSVKSVSTAASGGSATSDGSSSDRMDVHDFLRAIEVDRILVQVLLMNVHLAVFQLIELSEQENRAGAASTARSRTESGTDVSPFLISLEKQITESVSKFKEMQSVQQKRSFSLVKAVGQVALSAAIGVAKTIGFGASAIIEARRETLDHNTKLNYSSPVPSGASSPRAGAALVGGDKEEDPEADEGETEVDLVSRLNLSTSRPVSVSRTDTPYKTSN